MAYETSKPPLLIAAGIGGAGSHRLWSYKSADAATVVRVDGYITNGAELGMKAGDLVNAVDTDASPISVQTMIVSAVNADGSVDLSDGTAVAATDTD